MNTEDPREPAWNPAPVPGATEEASQATPPASEPEPKQQRTPHSNAEELSKRVVSVLQTVYDPEIPINIYEIGLIYDVSVYKFEAAQGDAEVTDSDSVTDSDEDAEVHVKMTLTTPACPVAGTLPGEVEQRVGTIPGVARARVDLVWDPPWSPAMMSEAARLQLNL